MKGVPINGFVEKLEQAKEENADKIKFIKNKLKEDKDFGKGLPSFLGPEATLKILKYERLENLMNEYEAHFQCKINTMGMKMGLDGWEHMLHYCIEENKRLEEITNKDIYEMKHAMDGCLEEYEIYDIPVTYQTCWLLRKIFYGKRR